MAWQLMNVARNLENKEGPGDVQLLEVDDDVYQRMETQDESDVGAFIKSLRDDSTPVKYERKVLQSPDQQNQCKTEPQSYINPGEDSGFTDESLQNRDVSWDKWAEEKHTHHTSFSSSVLSEDGLSFLDDYAGSTPLHGLSRVVECQEPDGYLCFFLCHCCRIRANKDDIINHLASSSHLFNYLTEIIPEQLNVNLKDNLPYLHLMVKRLEQQEGRGMLKIVTVPESLSGLLTGKNYHQCVNMLCKSLTHSNTHKKTPSPKGSGVNICSAGDVPGQYPAQQFKRKKKKNKNKMKTKKRRWLDTVFKVSLPLTQGDVLLERTSFSTDNLPLFDLPENDKDHRSSPCFEEVDCDLKSFDSNYYDHTVLGDTSEPTQHLYGQQADVDQNPSDNNVYVTSVEDVETCGPVDPCFNQHGDLSGSGDHVQYEERKHCSQYAALRPTSPNWQNDDNYQAQGGRLMPSVSHNQGWAMPDSSYRHGPVSTEQQYNLSSRREAETLAAMWPREERHCSMNTNAGNNDYNRYNTANNAWRHGNVPNNMLPMLDSAAPNMQPCGENVPANNVGLSSHHETHFQTNHRDPQSYTHFGIEQVHSAPQGNWIQVISYQDGQVDHGAEGYSNYSEMIPQRPFFYNSGSTTQSYNFTQPGEFHGPGASHYGDDGPYQSGTINPAGVGRNPHPYQHFSQF
ncbi:uncharacterized protein LOC114472090 isoform X2 [Gouania willdenowi]|nr:uncharacterized protein LOC114472090 isoform X2 [Gouania willdenowi]